MKSLSETIQVEATEQYFPVVLFMIMLYKAASTVTSVDEILKYDHLTESYSAESCLLSVCLFCVLQNVFWDFFLKV